MFSRLLYILCTYQKSLMLFHGKHFNVVQPVFNKSHSSAVNLPVIESPCENSTWKNDLPFFKTCAYLNGGWKSTFGTPCLPILVVTYKIKEVFLWNNR